MYLQTVVPAQVRRYNGPPERGHPDARPQQRATGRRTGGNAAAGGRIGSGQNRTRANRGGTRAEQGHPASRHRKPAPGLLRHRPRRPLPDAECRQQGALGRRHRQAARRRGGNRGKHFAMAGEQSTRLRRGEDRRRSGTRRQRRKTLLPQRHRPDPGGRPNRRDSRHQHRHHRAEAR